MVKRKGDSSSDADDALAVASAAAEAALASAAVASEPQQQQSGTVTVATAHGVDTPAAAAAAASASASASAPNVNATDDVPMPALNAAGAGGHDAAAAADLVLAEAAAAAQRQREAERTAAAVIAGTEEPPKKKQRMTWLGRLEQLKEFKALKGHCNVNIRYKANPTLGKWCNNMREQYKLYCRKTKLVQEGREAEANQLPKCPMNSERVRLLEEVGFQWSTNRLGGFDDIWDRRLEELKQYQQANGNCNVPHGYKENPNLAEWVHRQRCTYVAMKDREKTGETMAEQKLRAHVEHMKKLGKKPAPSPIVVAAAAASQKNPEKEAATEETIRKRMAILEKMGFEFRKKQNIWLQRLQELKDYKAENGDCDVPITYPPNPTLGRWVHTQRHQEKLRRENRTDKKKRSSTMTDERFELLDAIGFSWEVRASTKGGVMKSPHLYSWEDRFEELRGFYQTTGHCIVPANHNPYLNQWCLEQKELLIALQVDPDNREARARMSEDLVQQLASVGFTSSTDVPPPPPEYAAVAAMAAPAEQHHHQMGHDAVAVAVAAAEGSHLPELGETESQQV